ncbi:antigen WC1.1-like [Notamacropus eugenii]|uniref:antigen WC1.1-like n=1 Tax=Notamacropus eugenii TaxID=9315 RepID=UPI003B66C77A
MTNKKEIDSPTSRPSTDTNKLRLSGGETPCSGRVEFWDDGAWGTICDFSENLAGANVVCQQLSCGSALSSTSFGPGKGIIWAVWCSGNEPSLWDCDRWRDENDCLHEADAGVICSGFVKLEAGDGPCNGRVEVNSGTKWNTVCDWNFTLPTANIICAELKCGTAVSIMKGAHFGRGNGPIWDKEFQCNGSELLLSLCPTVLHSQEKCSHSMDVGVICSRYTDFRLMDGSSQCEGRVEIQVLGTWRTLCASHWDLADANVLCHQLHCGIAMKPPEEAHFGRGRVPIIGDTFYCTGTESHLRNCSVTILGTSPCSKGKVASVVCSGNQTQSLTFNNSQSDQEKVPILFSENGPLRLLNGRGPCSGRVEVYYNGTWGTICDDSWDLSDAHVVCRQLGCGVALEAMASAHFGQGSGPIWLDELSCSGNESHLGECPSLHWGQHDCRHKEDAGVLCSGLGHTQSTNTEGLTGALRILGSQVGRNVIDCPTSGPCTGKDKLRLIGGETPCSGRVEIWHNGSWGTVCDDSWDLADVNVVCQQLGCGSALAVMEWPSFSPGNGTIWLDDVQCIGKESSLWDCPASPWGQNDCKHEEDAGVMCSVDSTTLTSTTKDTEELRLSGGETRCSGRVEIWHSGTWGTVCYGYFNQAGANVVCKHLGCGSTAELTAFGPGKGTIWGIQCSGRESSLWDCPRQRRESYCTHTADIGVTCSGFVKLEAGDGPCNGRVEVNSGRTWSTVCHRNFILSTAKVICAELKCGTAVAIMKRAHFGRGNGHIYDKEFHCNGSEPLLSLCPTVPHQQGKCSHDMDVGVICSRYTDFRLMDGSSQCEGRVEIQVLGTWRTLCDSHWDMADANVLCRQLHCGVAMKPPEDANFDQENVPITGDTFYCTGTESHLWNCSVTILGTSPCSTGKVSSVFCSGNQTQSLTFKNTQSDQENAPVLFSENGQLRLLNGRGPCSGRVEVHYNGTWGTICDDSWDLNDAHVVCRQLGCGVALEVMVSAYFGEGSGPIWLDELSCFGNESHLGECPSLHWGQHDCRHKEDVGVLCSESLDLRLVSQEYKCSGWLEIFYNGTWGRVCSNSMDGNTLSVICRHLSCGAKGYIETLLSPTKSLLPRWIDKINCQGQESFLWHCPSQYWDLNSCQPEEETHVICEDKDKLRLIGGETPCSGRVEIWHNGSWGTVCDDSWDLADVNVVCQQLGCGSALAGLEWPSFSPGSGSIWLDDVQCKGIESSLWDCPASPWGQNDCKHEEDAGVMCSGPITTTVSAPLISGIGSLLGIVCLILGALLFLVLILLGIQVHRGRIQQQALSRYEDSLNEAVYQEIDYYLTVDKKDLFSSPDISSWPVDSPGDGYDDAEELSGPEIPPVSQMNEGSALGTTDEWDEQKESNTRVSPEFSGGFSDSRMGEDAPPISSEDLGALGSFKTIWCFQDSYRTGDVSMVLERLPTAQTLMLLFCSFLVTNSDKDKIRLSGGETRCSGRVEIWHKGSWGTVCDDSWDLADANVVCRQLGCGSALAALEKAVFGPGSGTIWLDEVKCTGRESFLWDCRADPWGKSNCYHTEDAGVVCSVSLSSFSLSLILSYSVSVFLLLCLYLYYAILEELKIYRSLQESLKTAVQELGNLDQYTLHT